MSESTENLEAIRQSPQQPIVVNINNTPQKQTKAPKPAKLIPFEKRFNRRFRKLHRYYFRTRLFNLFFHAPLPTVVFIPDYVAYTLQEMQNVLADFRRAKEVWENSIQDKEDTK